MACKKKCCSSGGSQTGGGNNMEGSGGGGAATAASSSSVAASERTAAAATTTATATTRTATVDIPTDSTYEAISTTESSGVVVPPVASAQQQKKTSCKKGCCGGTKTNTGNNSSSKISPPKEDQTVKQDSSGTTGVASTTLDHSGSNTAATPKKIKSCKKGCCGNNKKKTLGTTRDNVDGKLDDSIGPVENRSMGVTGAVAVVEDKFSKNPVDTSDKTNTEKKKNTSSCCSKGTCSSKTKKELVVTSNDTKKTKEPSCCTKGSCSSSKKKDVDPIGSSAVAKQMKDDDDAATATTCCSDPSSCSLECCSTNVCLRGVSPGPVISSKTKKPQSSSLLSVRSTFSAKGICCASEVPVVESLFESKKGVTSVMVNVPLRQVVVNHDPTVLPASSILQILNDDSFDAAIIRDGGVHQPKIMSSKTCQGGPGRSKFHVSYMCCASEVPAIRSVIEPLTGVSNVSVNTTTKHVFVDHDASQVTAHEICKAMNDEAFGASVLYDYAATTNSASSGSSSFVVSNFRLTVNDNLDDGGGSVLTEFLGSYPRTIIQDFNMMESNDEDNSSSFLDIVHNPFFVTAERLADDIMHKTGINVDILLDGATTKVWDFSSAVGVDPNPSNDKTTSASSIASRPQLVISGIFWALSMLSLLGEKLDFFKYAAFISIAFGFPSISVKAWGALKRFQFDSNCLMAFATLGSLALMKFTEAATITFLFSFSEWLEERATSRARDALTAILDLRPERANLIHPQTSELLEVQATAVPLGASVVVRAGDKVPCDGIVTEGTTTVDESSLTGESKPVKKTVNDSVSGGTINSGNAQIVVQTTRTSDDSAVSRLIRLVEEAQANRSDTEKIVDSFAKIYTPLVVLGASLMCTVPWIFGPEVGRFWFSQGLVLVVIACPCALLISTPVSYVAGIAALANNGVLVKGGATLEALGNTKQIFFDKTGTLTMGKYKLLELDAFSSQLSRRQVLEYLALIEERASHPLAEALVNGAKAEGVKVPGSLFVHDLTYLPSLGVVGIVNGVTVHVGNEKLFRKLGMFDMMPPSVVQKALSWEAMSYTVGFISVGDNGIVAVYCVADAVRSEAASILQEFRRMKIDMTMLTGDNAETAQAIGKPLGLSGTMVRSELLPEEKLAFVSSAVEANGNDTRLKSVCSTFFGKPDVVLMVGDGVNDAPSLAAANVGVAMGEGAALAMETADVTLTDSNLTKLCYSIKTGKRVLRKIEENIIFSVAVKALVLGFALAGRASLWAAITSDVFSMIAVTLNGMTLLPKRRERKTLGTESSIDDDLEAAKNELSPLLPANK